MLNSKKALSVEWSNELKGGKAVRLSGIFDRLGYEVRRALSIESAKCSFSTAHCSVRSEDAHVTSLHFLIQSVGRDVPIIHPEKSSDGSESKSSAVALQEQKEIFLLPTVQVSNLLHSEIHVLLTETGKYRKCYSTIVLLIMQVQLITTILVQILPLLVTILGSKLRYHVDQQLIFMLIPP